MKGKRISSVVAVLLVGITARAATITVSNTNNAGAGSLRAALASVGNGDVISATSVTGIIVLSGQLVVSNSVTIAGPGPASLSISGNFASRVFQVTNAANAFITGLTITNGFTSGFPGGAGIWNNHSTLTLSNCSITGNYSGGSTGGGIFNDGASGDARVSIIDSTLSLNLADSGGAGIYNSGFGGTATVSVVASTFDRNFASGSGNVGGGILNDGNFGRATLLVTNSTFSRNLANFQGAAIYNGGASGTGILIVVASTLSSNATTSTGIGGTIRNNDTGANLKIANTILDTIPGGVNIVNAGGIVTSDGYNLSSESSGGVFTNATDQINTNPLLDPAGLRNNGGPTQTHALLPGSPAIDRGKSFGLAADQRGLPRTVDDPCLTNATGGDGSDIGAFETQEICVNLAITAIAREANNIHISWTTYAGKSNFVERTAGAAGNFTNNFTGITNIFTTGTATNYLDIGAATNVPARYYRIRLVP